MSPFRVNGDISLANAHLKELKPADLSFLKPFVMKRKVLNIFSSGLRKPSSSNQF